MAATSTYLERWSTVTMMYRLPSSVVGRGPKWLIPMAWKQSVLEYRVQSAPVFASLVFRAISLRRCFPSENRLWRRYGAEQARLTDKDHFVQLLNFAAQNTWENLAMHLRRTASSARPQELRWSGALRCSLWTKRGGTVSQCEGRS